MSIPDEIMWEYFTMLTDLEVAEIDELKNSIDKDKANPFEIKKILGKFIVTELYDGKSADTARNSFENVTINKNTPDEIDSYKAPDEKTLHLPKILTELGITKSNSEARRLINSGSFKIDEQKFTELDVETDKLLNKTLQLGKRTFFTFI